jgi:hypothetical protein
VLEGVEAEEGAAEVETDGTILRCLVSGSFQPFLEALHGHEVVSLKSAVEGEPAPPLEGDR